MKTWKITSRGKEYFYKKGNYTEIMEQKNNIISKIRYAIAIPFIIVSLVLTVLANLIAGEKLFNDGD